MRKAQINKLSVIHLWQLLSGVQINVVRILSELFPHFFRMLAAAELSLPNLSPTFESRSHIKPQWQSGHGTGLGFSVFRF